MINKIPTLQQRLKDWLDEHIDDYVEVNENVYSVETNRLANDLIELLTERVVAI